MATDAGRGEKKRRWREVSNSTGKEWTRKGEERKGQEGAGDWKEVYVGNNGPSTTYTLHY